MNPSKDIVEISIGGASLLLLGVSGDTVGTVAGEAESGVEARSACKHHSTLAGRACVVVYLCCCLSFVFFEFSSVCWYL